MKAVHTSFQRFEKERKEDVRIRNEKITKLEEALDKRL